MSTICVSNCVDDARAPVRATYVNLYKWPESDAEFVKSAAVHGGATPRSRVVESISCRQMYLRSYTFSREETVHERTMKCLVKVKERVVCQGGRQEKGEVPRRQGKRRRWRLAMSRVKEYSCAAFCSVFRRLLLCSAAVDVIDRGM